MKREELIKRFRKVAWGRLYWNRGIHPHREG